EISVINVDKPPLAAPEVRNRLAQFAWRARVELTRAPTFLEKSRLFPGSTFVIGADTAERLVAARYYGGDDERMAPAPQETADRGSSFLVAVRIDAAGRVRSLADVSVPPRFAPLFTAIPEGRFRLDSSSSDIRARRRAAPGRLVPPGLREDALPVLAAPPPGHPAPALPPGVVERCVG